MGQANYKANSRERACHEVKIQPKEVEHPAQAWIQEEAQDAIQHGWSLLGKKLQSSTGVTIENKSTWWALEINH